MLVYRSDNHTEDHPTLATAAKQLAMAGKWGEEGRRRCGINGMCGRLSSPRPHARCKQLISPILPRYYIHTNAQQQICIWVICRHVQVAWRLSVGCAARCACEEGISNNAEKDSRAFG
jgi:uncharacterized protein YbdZ (MbtH family)